MSTELVAQLVTATVIGAAAGAVGSLMVIRRMALVGDALSHVALPGLAAALLLGIDPFIGALAALLIAVIGIWSLERRTRLPTDALVGVFFTVSLALGLLLTPEPELLEALFGDISAVTIISTLWACAAGFAIIMATVRVARPVVLGVVSRDLAKVNRVPIDRANFLFLAMVALVVALGIKVTGTLLTGALVIIPAATARNVSRSLFGFIGLSGLLGAVSGAAGMLLASRTGITAGPAIILVASACFLATVPLRR
jgi:ABC-type Mn2+/Zn2+ transport system permease subunit